MTPTARRLVLAFLAAGPGRDHDALVREAVVLVFDGVPGAGVP